MSTCPQAILIAGWAHGEKALSSLRKHLGGVSDVRLVSVSSLASAARAKVRGECSACAFGLLEMIEKSGRPQILCGWSMGGMAALEASLFRPELVSRLILISSTPVFYRTGLCPFGVEKSEIRALAGGIKRDAREALRGFMRRVYSDSEGPDGELRERMVEEALALGSEGLLKGLSYLSSVDLSGRLSQLSQPVLLLHGRRDCVISFEASAFLKEQLPSAELVLCEEADHGMPVSIPDVVATPIKTFLGEKTCRG